MINKNITSKGRVTLPAQSGMEKEILELAEKWGVDAVRDSDGTRLSEEILNMGFEVYSTLCLIREDNEWAKARPEYRQQLYLTSHAETATSDVLEIELMEHYFKEQLEIDRHHSPDKWWEVVDRTTGNVVETSFWSFIPEKGTVVLHNAIKWHRYTVSFLVYQKWEPVSMYNHIVNAWQEEHKLPLDPRHPEVRRHLLEVLGRWLDEHPQTDVVRFTTFFYNFDLTYNEKGKERQVDWFGYLSCVSPLALELFEAEYGYALKPEDFIDQGYYNSPFRLPSPKYLDWMEFNQKFVAGFAKECVELVHSRGKKAIMFLGDHWAGTEPYGRFFNDIGLDAVVGAAGDGVTTRMISDIPVKATEARFYPYFFPDVFCEGGDPVGELEKVWIKSRRAIMRKPVNRMGYGGYLSLALKFPDFVEHVAGICRQFREIHDRSGGVRPYSAPFKIAILNAWGKIRTWQTHQIAHSLWNRRCYSYLGILEALSGMNIDVEFVSFDDIMQRGISPEIKVIINAGDAGTSWSGDRYWAEEKLVTAIREWVFGGGGFIGVGEPTAFQCQGAFFQLADILGVQKETGNGVSSNKPAFDIEKNHFIHSDVKGEIDFGEGMNSVYPCSAGTKVLAAHNSDCSLAVNSYGKGRSVYISGLPFSFENTRLLQRAAYWAAGCEQDLLAWFSSNPATECSAYPGSGSFAVYNNSVEEQNTWVCTDNGNRFEISLKPMECRWFGGIYG